VWHVAAIALVSMVLSCDSNRTSEHAGMPDCPLHDAAPACPLHAEKHGTHECDCPTIGCADTDTGLMALFGAIGILAEAREMPAPVDAGAASAAPLPFADPLFGTPPAPPPRS
jgi:hypothetical protein